MSLLHICGEEQVFMPTGDEDCECKLYQSFGYNKDGPISQKTVTEKFDNVDDEISTFNQALSDEEIARTNNDLILQEQIDAINSQTDVVDVIGTYAELVAYDIEEHHIVENDIVKILGDSSHSDAISYWRWSRNQPQSGEYISAAGGGYWLYIGSQGPFYTKAEADITFAKNNDVYTKAEADLTFADKNSVYTKSEINDKFDDVYTKTQSDNNFLKKSDMFKMLWTGSWNSGSIAVPDFDKYTLFLVTLQGAGTTVIAVRYGGFFRGIGGYDSGTHQYTYAIGASYSGNTLTLTASTNISHNSGAVHGTRTNPIISSIIGII